MHFISDPVFYAAAIPAVIFVGLSKGGFGGAMALIGLPLMALVVSPIKAAAIMLPILIVMDIVSLWTWRGVFDAKTLKIMLPAGMVGIGIGWATASWVTAGEVRLLVGAVVGLWPFQHGVEPQLGDVVKGRVMTAETLLDLDHEDWPTEVFTPAPARTTSCRLVAAAKWGAWTLVLRTTSTSGSCRALR